MNQHPSSIGLAQSTPAVSPDVTMSPIRATFDGHHQSSSPISPILRSPATPKTAEIAKGGSRKQEPAIAKGSGRTKRDRNGLSASNNFMQSASDTAVCSVLMPPPSPRDVRRVVTVTENNRKKSSQTHRSSSDSPPSSEGTPPPTAPARRGIMVDLSPVSAGRMRSLNRKALVTLVIPLAFSFALTVAGVVAIICINLHYSNEAADTFPPTLATGLSRFIRGEMEAIMLQATNTQREFAACYLSGHCVAPVYDLANPTGPLAAVATAGESDHNGTAALLQAQMALRRQWHKQATVAMIRHMEGSSNGAINVVKNSFVNNAQSFWATEYEGLGPVKEGFTYYGDDVSARDGAALRREFYREQYDPRDPVSGLNATVVLPEGYHYFVPADHVFLNDLVAEDAQFDESVPPRSRKIPPIGALSLIFENDMTASYVYVLEALLRDTRGNIIGVTQINVDLRPIGERLNAFNQRITAMNPNPYEVTSFVMNDYGQLIGVSGQDAARIIRTTRSEDFYKFPDTGRGYTYDDFLADRKSLPSLKGHPHCNWLVMFEYRREEDEYIPYLAVLCQQVPRNYDGSPLVRAVAPHLASLCAEGGDQLGQGTRLQLAIDDSDQLQQGGVRLADYAVVCDEIATGATNFNDGTANFTQWRVVTMISSKEITDPLFDGLPTTIIIACVGVAVAALACIVAGLVSKYLLGRSE